MSFAALESALQEAGLESLPDKALAQLESYLELLLKWNSRLNLTAIREPEAILHRHFVECIQCAQALPSLGTEPTLLDFGSGAGFPGIPIAACRNEIRVTLAESQGKKAAFLREAVRSLGLYAEIFAGRVESMAPERRFAAVTLRAVDKMAEACGSAFERASPGGWMAIFATDETEASVKTALPKIAWRRKLPVYGLSKAKILLGQREG